MADFSEFMSHILPHAMTCPEPAAFKALRDSAAEFCRRTRAWRYIGTTNVKVGRSIILPVPEGANMFELRSASLDGKQLELSSFEMMDLDAEPGSARYLCVEPDGRVIISPEQDGELRVVMYLIPDSRTEELPDFLLEDHGEYLGAGALKDLLVLPNQPYTNPQNAGMFAMKFEGYINTNFALYKRGKQRATIRTKARFL